MQSNAKMNVIDDANADRREGKRQTLVFRVAALDNGERASFCLLKNISADGVQVRSYAPLEVGATVTLFVGEEKPVAGQVVWYRDLLAGIKFLKPLSPVALLRVEQKTCNVQRRALPRLNTEAAGKLKALGRSYDVTLRDISASGAKLETKTPLSAAGAAVLQLPDLPPIDTFVRWSDEHEIGLSFATPLPIQIITDWLAERRAVRIS